MYSEEPQSHDPEDDGSLFTGFGLGCLSQIAFFILGFVISTAPGLVKPGSKADNIVLVSWGLTQWIALIPLIVYERRKGRRSTVQGLIIIGCIGLLLSSACATMLLR